MSRRVERRAWAKINLCLSVASPEPPDSPRPGWHRIASWFGAIDLYDTLVLTSLPTGRETFLERLWAPDAPRATPIDWPAERDLALRALRLLEGHAGRPLPTHLRIEKRIPVGGGLGGGSSDAAATLLAANELHRLGLSSDDLRRLGAQLGADVPFFLDDHDPPRPALVTSFGERVERVDPVGGVIELAVPAFSCPTPEVYAALDRARPEPAVADEARVRRVIEQARRHGLHQADLFNDLAEPACMVRPGLARLLEGLRARGWRRALVTGSGACVFWPAVNSNPRPPDDSPDLPVILRLGLV